MTSSALMLNLQTHVMNALTAGLRLYTHRVPFHRGRGAFIRVIEFLKRRGWPPPLTDIGHGLVMEFEPSLLGWTLFERGQWEPEQSALFLSLLRPGAVVINVGANTGYYTLLAARIVGERGHVHAFEIQPAILEILTRNVVRNRRERVVSVVASGCFSSAGEATVEHHGDPGSARVSLTGQGIKVPLITLDAYAEAAGVDRVDVILIDAEGADFEILKGAAGVLARHRPAVIAEAHHLQVFGGSEDELCAFMTGLGYVGQPMNGEFSRDIVFTRADGGESSPAV